MVPMVKVLVMEVTMKSQAPDFLHSYMIYFMVLVTVAMGMVDMAAMVFVGMVVMGSTDMDM